MQPKLRFPLLIMAAALLALPTSASASTRSAMTTLPGDDAAIGMATAKCPHGQRATGGGFQAPAFSPTVGVVVFESRKIGQRSWQASGVEAGSASATLTAFVYCDKSAPKTKEKSLTVSPTHGAITPALASCGHAGKAQAGGFLIPTLPKTSPAGIVDSFRSSGKSWQSRAYLSFPPGAPTLTSYVYCADQQPPKARPGSITSSTPGELKTASPGTASTAGKSSPEGSASPMPHTRTRFTSSPGSRSGSASAGRPRLGTPDRTAAR